MTTNVTVPKQASSIPKPLGMAQLSLFLNLELFLRTLHRILHQLQLETSIDRQRKKTEMNETTPGELARDTRIIAGLILSTTIEKFTELKEIAEQKLGCKILYQRSAAPWMKLWIIEQE